MIIACGLPFHLGEVAILGSGILAGAAIVARLCWCYIKAKTTRSSRGCNSSCSCECSCDCCGHNQTLQRLPNSNIDVLLGVPHDPGCTIVHDGPCKPQP
jgi:hypothetical protein